MANVTFYILKTRSSYDDTKVVEDKVCNLVSKYWRQGYRIIVSCEDEKQAIRLDDVLWQDPKTFIPHDIISKPSHYPGSGKLTLIQVYQNSSHNLFIHLALSFAESTPEFHEVIDFVPSDESLKRLARRRYRNYRELGCSLNTITLSNMV